MWRGRAPHAEGESFVPGPVFQACRQGLVCNSLSETCAPPVAEGEACGSAMDCAVYAPEGLTCDRTSGRCARWRTLAAGTACTFDEACAPEEICGLAPVEGGPPGCQPGLVCTRRDGGVHSTCEPRDT